MGWAEVRSRIPNVEELLISHRAQAQDLDLMATLVAGCGRKEKMPKGTLMGNSIGGNIHPA